MLLSTEIKETVFAYRVAAQAYADALNTQLITQEQMKPDQVESLIKGMTVALDRLKEISPLDMHTADILFEQSLS
jgi:hypothetical protein